MEKKYSFSDVEREIAELWKKARVYEFNSRSGKELFTIDTPPPTVSGSLHIGHVFSYTHTDILARYKRMRGAEVFYPMGFDDNGLPTERFVEKRTGKKATEVGRSEFIKICLKESSEVEKEFEALWRRLGLSVDWSLVYSTISEKSRITSQYSFIELFKCP